MAKTAKEAILGKLKEAPQTALPPRPAMPPPKALSWGREEMVEKFVEKLTLLGCTVHRVRDAGEALDKLTEIVRTEGLTRILVAEDDVVAPLNLPGWGRKTGVEVFTPGDCRDRAEFKRVAFEEAQAGVTGVDFAIAESGTLCLIHDKRQARLVSLAPIRHIAVVPADRVRPVYEDATDKLFEAEGKAPAHLTFSTGPSMTADIQATLFTGMHGPRDVTVILMEGKAS